MVFSTCSAANNELESCGGASSVSGGCAAITDFTEGTALSGRLGSDGDGKSCSMIGRRDLLSAESSPGGAVGCNNLVCGRVAMARVGSGRAGSVATSGLSGVASNALFPAMRDAGSSSSCGCAPFVSGSAAVAMILADS